MANRQSRRRQRPSAPRSTPTVRIDDAGHPVLTASPTHTDQDDALASLTVRVTILESQVIALTMALSAVQPLLDRIKEMASPTPTSYQVTGEPPLAEQVRSPAPPDPSWYPILHIKTSYVPEGSGMAPPPCYKPALYLITQIQYGEAVPWEMVRVQPPGTLSWRQPKQDEPSVCSSCGAPIDFLGGDLDASAAYFHSPPPMFAPAPENNPARANAATRRSGSVPEVRVMGAILPRTPVPPPGQTPPAPTDPALFPKTGVGQRMTPEAAADSLAELARLAQATGLASPESSLADPLASPDGLV